MREFRMAYSVPAGRLAPNQNAELHTAGLSHVIAACQAGYLYKPTRSRRTQAIRVIIFHSDEVRFS
jgi:hypothetical protein